MYTVYCWLHTPEVPIYKSLWLNQAHTISLRLGSHQCALDEGLLASNSYDMRVCRLSVEMVHSSLWWPQSELHRGPERLWLCFRSEFRQKFGLRFVPEMENRERRTPAVSCIRTKCEPSLKVKILAFFFFFFYQAQYCALENSLLCPLLQNSKAKSHSF